jgi:hypothetical protein
MAKNPVSFRWDSEIKEMADRRAAEEHRSLTGYIEWLIMEDAKKHPAPPQRRRRPGGEA